ncbi:hypothetical protein [Mycobacterium sp. DL592]|uniref:hypothetical protein n=1 Tax=Mycobacterium sp. DL592 TaxID=2675524 RepID=UPI0014222587|nr:hypothetical protein [Mycobacterium sp. DL592]
MTTPKPPDTPEAIAKRLAEAAKKAVDETTQVAFDAFDKVNGPSPSYTPSDAIGSTMQLARAMFRGGMSIARVGLQVQWDRRVLLVADNIASIMGTGISDVITVAEDTAKKLNDKNTTDKQQALVDAAVVLTSIGALRGAEILETAVAGPGPYLDPVIRRTFKLKSTDVKPYESTLAVKEFVRQWDGEDHATLVAFDPPTAKLAANANEFTIVMNTAGLPSATYEGVITATQDAPPHKIRELSITILAPETSDPPEL